jgi:DnaK suppressor protein
VLTEEQLMAKSATTAKRSRADELRKMLEDRLHELTRDVHGRIRDARVDSINERQAIDEGETSELDTQDELEFALIQMKAETLNRIDAALRRLEEGTYGRCFECGDEIGEARLRALPFAVRCKDCEEIRELAEQRDRTAAQRRTVSALLFD